MTIFLLIVVTIVVAVGIALAAGRTLRPNQFQAMRAFAQLYDGKFTQTKTPIQTTVSFDLNGQPAMLRIKPPVGYDGRSLTEFRTTWPEARLRLQIHPRSKLRPDYFYDESPTIESGDAHFDEQYRLYAENSEAARKLIISGVFSALDDLNQMARPGAAYVEIHDGFLFVTLEKTFGYVSQLEQVVAYCSEIRVPSAREAAAEPASVANRTLDPVSPITRSICNACGDVVKEDGVACDDCGAIYHRRCWDKKVGCVLYSCEGKTASEAAVTN
ncbi:hypothetical protein LOC68_20310 [Blastopirellula sp. JC732]|uniref:Phorbol-ester/DAG-type domain-containing protein n=1 Tax=Blastopirellula sediminis TaxID=2894196 RepID=A0A9X1SH22_9BACT|nr:RING finger protein [Blastopirellula sediminis]MCC9605956.1 hypothetical protein [Blastopirellula sediminis]MCC9630745.1 hypothetical protein [Blastopirellula sediminis]